MPVIGTVILHGKLDAWKENAKNSHYHQGELTCLCVYAFGSAAFCEGVMRISLCAFCRIYQSSYFRMITLRQKILQVDWSSAELTRLICTAY